MEKQVRSKERVNSLGEVMTAENEVNGMLRLLPAECWELGKTFLEPACGNGNIVMGILRRKLDSLNLVPNSKLGSEILLAVATIYGVDICPENVTETRLRINRITTGFACYHGILSLEFIRNLERILETTIIHADFLNLGNETISQWGMDTHGALIETKFPLKEIIQPK